MLDLADHFNICSSYMQFILNLDLPIHWVVIILIVTRVQNTEICNTYIIDIFVCKLLQVSRNACHCKKL